MSAIYLIRHAQASFGKENYDQLSELGYRQSALLREAINISDKADLVISGGQMRHLQTAETCLAKSDMLSKLTLEPSFNEFDFENIIEEFDHRWRDKTAFSNYLLSQDNPRKVLNQIFKSAVQRWISGEHDGDYKEDWPAFKMRITGGITAIKKIAGNSKNIFLFTSAGPIAVVLQWVMGLDNKHTFALNENLMNTGITRLLYNEERMSVSYINNYSHLERHGEEFLSFR